MKIKKQVEFDNIIRDILKNEEVISLRYEYHHGISRLDHSLNVARLTYNISKLFKIKTYKDTTRAALLHDFFQEEVADKNFVARLRKHPKCALKNATNNFDLSEKQMDIIKSHMFPITFTPPKYLESWIVDVVDDISAIQERGTVIKQHAKVVGTFLLVLLLNC